MTAEDVYEMLRKIRYDLTAAQGKLTDVFSMLGELNLQDTPAHECPRCGLTFRAETILAEHVYHSHGGPEPEHWKRIEALIRPDFRWSCVVCGQTTLKFRGDPLWGADYPQRPRIDLIYEPKPTNPLWRGGSTDGIHFWQEFDWTGVER